MKMNMIPLLVCAAAALALPSFATTYTWNASVASGNWNDAANWLVNGAETTGYPSSSSDVAVFAANTTASVALTTARTISKLDLSAKDVSLTLTQGAASLDASKLTVSTLSLAGENLVFTLASVSLTANNKPMMGEAAKLFVKDGAYFNTGVFHNQPATADSGTTAMGNNEQGGQIYVSGGSTAMFTGLHMKNGLLEIDDATVNHEWGVIFWAETGTNQTTVRFKGKNPILKCTKSDQPDDYKATYGKEKGFNAHFEFVVPEGGYTAAPLQNDYGTYKFLTGEKGTSVDGTFAIDVSADSPANFAGEPLTAQLIKCTNKSGIETSNVKSINLPNETDSYAWGTGTLDVTLTGTDIAVSPTTEGAAWKGINLTFATSAKTRELYVAYGATDGGSDAASWTTTAKLADLAADATSYEYFFSQTAGATWGSDSFKVVRFYILVDGTMKHWSPATVWTSLSAPIFSATPTADGAGGDAITVTGEMSAYPGDTCAFKVLTGKSADALTDEWTDDSWVLPTSDGSKAFSLTLCETDAESARLAPGNEYYVAVVAESAGTVATSAVATVTTASGAAKFEAKAASVNRRTVTFSGKLSAIGFNGKSEVTLWVGESESENALELKGSAITVTSAGTAFSWEPIQFEVFGKTYYYQLRTTSTSAGGTATTTAKTTIGNFTTTDGAVTYQWTGEAGDGDWTNPANWNAGAYEDDCLGYPASATSLAKFAAGTTAEFTLAKHMTIGTLDLSAGGVSVTFKGIMTESASEMPRLTVATALNLNGNGNAFTIDGMRLAVTKEKEAGNVTLGSGSTWIAKNGAVVWLGGDYFYNRGGKVCVEGGSSFTCQRHYLQDAAYLLVSNATFAASHRTVWNSTDAANPDVIRLGGANALYKMTYPDYHFFCAGTANAVLNLDFVVPKTGFAAAPLQSVKEWNDSKTTKATYAIGSGNTDILKAGGVLNVNLIQSEGDMNSEAVTTPLVSWPGAGISKTVVQEGSKSRGLMKFVWKDSSGAQTTGDYPTALEAVIPGRSGFILTIR